MDKMEFHITSKEAQLFAEIDHPHKEWPETFDEWHDRWFLYGVTEYLTGHTGDMTLCEYEYISPNCCKYTIKLEPLNIGISCVLVKPNETFTATDAEEYADDALTHFITMDNDGACSTCNNNTGATEHQESEKK